MNEKRFTVDDDGIYDNQEKKHFKFIAYDWIECDIYECCDFMNGKEDTISKQLDRIIELQDKYRILEFNHSRLEKRNKAQYEKIGEQQSIIEQLRQSQDVKEFSALFNQSIALQRKIKDLKEENEKLRKQCFELEKDYVIETSDISDKIYLDDEIRELKQRYGVDDE